jgi:hypothetical protein
MIMINRYILHHQWVNHQKQPETVHVAEAKTVWLHVANRSLRSHSAQSQKGDLVGVCHVEQLFCVEPLRSLRMRCL